jgi:hypothetical protein
LDGQNAAAVANLRARAPCDEGAKLAFSRDGKLALVASACKGERLYVYNAATFALLTTVPLFKPPYKKTPSGVTVKSCWISAEPVFSPEKNQETSVTIPDASGYLRLCDVATGKVKEYLGLEGEMINFFAFLSSDNGVLSQKQRRFGRRSQALDCRRRRPFERRRARVERRDDVFF